jgi:hypothetical protein
MSGFKEKFSLKEAEVHLANTPFLLYNKFHKCLDENGVFYPVELDDEMLNDVRKLKNYLGLLNKNCFLEEEKKDSFLVPVIFEYTRESWLSTLVWENIEKKLGNEVWKYVRKARVKNANVGVKRVQEALNRICKPGFFHQMKLNYYPLTNKNFYVWAYIKSASSDFVKFIEQAYPYSISISVYPCETGFFCIFLVSKEGLERITNIDTVEISRWYIENVSKAEIFWKRDNIKFKYYNLFDPEKKEWKKLIH